MNLSTKMRIVHIETEIDRYMKKGLRNVSLCLGRLTPEEAKFLKKRYLIKKEWFGYYRFSQKQI